MVPNGWETGLFKDGIELISGQHVEAHLVNHEGKGQPYLTGPADFINGQIIVTKYTSEGKKFSKRGDLLITVKGSGTGKIIASDGEYVISRQLMAIRPTKFHPVFAFYNLMYNTSRYEDAASGLIPGISRDDILNTPLLIPSFLEQQKIAEILSTWDKTIVNTENLIANSQMQKKALMQQLLTGKKRLLDESGVRFSGEWKRTQLKTFLTESTLRNKNSNIERVLSITNHSGFVLPEEQFSKRVASNNVENYKIVSNGQFGYNPSRLNVGSFGRLDQYSEGILSPMYVIFNVNKSKVHSDYFLFWMGSGEANQRIKNSTQGSVRESVGFDALCAIPFNLPSILEQKKIAEVLSTADREIELLQTKLEHLKQEKKALMQQLLTGKRRVVIN